MLKFQAIELNLNFLKLLISYIFVKVLRIIPLGNFFYLNKKEVSIAKNSLRQNQVLIKIDLCCLCSTDLKILKINLSKFSSAFLESKSKKKKKIYLGHELIGRVCDVGSNVKNFKNGDRVIYDNMDRNYNIEETIFGGFCEYFITSDTRLTKVYPGLSNEKASLVEPLAASLQAVKKIKNYVGGGGGKILIYGSGLIGQGIAIFLRFFYKNSIKIYFVSKSKNDYIPRSLYDEFFLFNSSYFEQIASSTNDKVLKKPFNKILINGFDVVFDCSGANLILNSLLRTTAISGSVILVSNNLNYELFDPTPIWHRDINVMGSHGFDKFFKKDTPTFDFIQSLIVNNDINIDHFRIKKYEFRNFDKLLNEKNNNEMYVRNAVEF